MSVVWSPSLNDEESQWRTTAARIADRSVRPYATDVDARQRYPAEALDALHECGISSMFLPSDFGGGGASMTAFCAVMEELAQACASTAGVVATLQLGAMPILEAGTAHQKARLLTGLTQERRAISFALSERHSGSDPANMLTSATSENGGWRIRGEKAWIGNGGLSHYYVVFAPTAPGSGGAVTASFIV